MSMFCYQCEQTAKGTGCTVAGVCGKQPDVATLQDLLVHAVKGIGYWADLSRAVGGKDEEIDRFVIDALFATVTNVDFDPDAIAALLAEASRLHKKARELFEKHNGRAFSGFVPAGAKLWVLPEDRAEQIKLGEEHGVKEGRVSPDISRSARSSSTASRGMPPTRTTPACSARNRTRSTPSPTRRWGTCSTTSSTWAITSRSPWRSAASTT